MFTDEEIAELRCRFQLWARRKGGPDHGQPYCLHALQILSSLIQDRFPCLLQGVPTGFDKNIPASNVFASRDSDSTIHAELLLCESNWSSAEANPELLRQLVAKEVEAGYLVPVALEEARQRWPDRLAVGKLSIVSSDGRPDRLVVDNSFCNTNALCENNQSYTLPLLGSVRACFPLRGKPCDLASFIIDVKLAHKTMRLKQADQGRLGVQCDGQHYFYRVCPFGACFSALWWARLGSLCEFYIF